MEGTFNQLHDDEMKAQQNDGKAATTAAGLKLGDAKEAALYENVHESRSSSNGKDGNVVFIMEEADTGPYAGMGKELVLKYSDTPFFNRLRTILLALFIVAWLSLLGGVIYLAVTHKSCEPEPQLDWWQTANAYRVYVRSFKDDNADGNGDLAGLKEHLPYLKDIGVNAIWLSAIYESPMRDLGYDVSNHTSVHSMFGNHTAIQELLEAVHKEGMKLILDFIPNHTSDQHPWFLSTSDDDKELYVERKSRPTNNWVSIYGGSAWANASARWYLHQYRDFEPDLNYRNNHVKQKMNEVVQFWVDMGVDGFRLDGVGHLYEDYLLKDEKPANSNSSANTSASDYKHWDHANTFNMPEVMDMVTAWRSILSNGAGTYRFMAADVDAPPAELRMYYGRREGDGVDYPLNSLLFGVDGRCDGDCVWRLVNEWLSAIPKGRTANWALGNENVHRLATRAGDSLVDSFNMLLLLLPGAAITYYGDELGLPDLSADTLARIPAKDLAGRDAYRTPMAWDEGPKAGFCRDNQCSGTWLPIHPNASSLSVKEQLKSLTSHLTVFKNVSALRRERTFQIGHMDRQSTADSCVLAFRRYFDGRPTYLVAINFCAQERTVNLADSKTPADSRYPITLAAKTGGVPDGNFEIGQEYELGSVKIPAHQGLVFTWDHVIDEII